MDLSFLIEENFYAAEVLLKNTTRSTTPDTTPDITPISYICTFLLHLTFGVLGVLLDEFFPLSFLKEESRL